MSKKMGALVMSILCATSMMSAMEYFSKNKSAKNSDKKVKKNVPALELKNSGDSQPSRSPKSFGELKDNMGRTKNSYGRSGEDSSNQKK
jgi:hypothetical protein